MKIRNLIIAAVSTLFVVSLILIAAPQNVVAVPSIVQTVTTNGGGYVNSYSKAFTSNITGGDLLVMSLTLGSADTVGSIVDNNTNTWTLATSSISAGNRQTLIYYVANAHSGATTVTFTAGAGQYPDSALIMREYSGIATASPLDQVTSGADSAGATLHTSAASGATTVNNELVVVAGGVSNNTPTYSAGTGYGNAASQSGFDLYTSGFMEDAYITSTGSQTGTFNTVSSVQGQTSVATFKSAAQTPVVSGGNNVIFFQ
jgi:hypothetical protein